MRHRRIGRRRFPTADGAYQWLEGRPTLLRDDDGRAFAIEIILRDMTDSVAAEQALFRQRSALPAAGREYHQRRA